MISEKLFQSPFCYGLTGDVCLRRYLVNVTPRLAVMRLKVEGNTYFKAGTYDDIQTYSGVLYSIGSKSSEGNGGQIRAKIT